MIGLLQTATAVAPGIHAWFLASGATGAVSYSVRPHGAGGIINNSTGAYTAPARMNEDPAMISDTIEARDSTGAIAIAQILVGTPLLLLCEIIQKEMGLARGRVYLWDQKIMQPTDGGLYVAVSMPTCRPFGNNIRFDNSAEGLDGVQTINMKSTVDLDIISRGPAARDQKELVVMALNSLYSEQQQEANSFYISRLPEGGRFINLSEIDGAAIPYRYKISFAMQYAVTKVSDVPYYNVFEAPQVVTNS